MIVLHKTKIFERDGSQWVSIRDYEWEKAYKSGEDVLIRVGNEWTRLEPWRIAMDREQFTKDTFKSKVNSKKHPEYKLYDFEWRPSDKAKELGETLLEDLELKKLSEQCL